MIRTWLPSAGEARRRLEAALASGLAALRRDDVVPRLWNKEDVWTAAGREAAEDAGVRRFLGWLDSPWPAAANPLAAAAEAFARDAVRDGLTDGLILGMGGSSLAPDMFGRIFAPPANGAAMRLRVLDSTCPDAVRRTFGLAPGRTLHVVSSKSGTTTETLSLLNVFFDRARSAPGGDTAGSRFAAVTDPGTPLETLGRELGFRKIFHGPPDVGGRFSALTPFGVVPAALGGIDLPGLLGGARAMAGLCRLDVPGLDHWPERYPDAANPGAALGMVLGTLAAAGRDKLLLRVPPSMPGLFDWIEQLIAESTGKSGRGLLPVPFDWDDAGGGAAPDRLVVILHAEGEDLPEDGLRALSDRGVPAFGLAVSGTPDGISTEALGEQLFLWEFATAVAGVFLRVNPFDQPNVELTKSMTRTLLRDAAASPVRPGDGGVLIPEDGAERAIGRALRPFLASGRPGDYIALQAFLDPSAANASRLDRVRGALGRKWGLPATAGFGPRYLHSTGQLHKGDAGRGLFVQLAGPPERDLPIPDIPGSPAPAPTFGALLSAQAGADRLALRERGRRVLRLEFTGPAGDALDRLLAAAESENGQP